jgi:hypothetical protein
MAPRTKAKSNGHNERATSRNKRPRSAVTSGRQLFVDGDVNSAWSRRFHDLLIGYISDLSAGHGADFLCSAQHSLIRRAASIQCELERLDAMLSRGEPIDLSRYGSVSGQLRRILETLYGDGLARKQRDVTPSLVDALNAPVVREPELVE